jgi:hypothetical protein
VELEKLSGPSERRSGAQSYLDSPSRAEQYEMLQPIRQRFASALVALIGEKVEAAVTPCRQRIEALERDTKA